MIKLVFVLVFLFILFHFNVNCQEYVYSVNAEPVLNQQSTNGEETFTMKLQIEYKTKAFSYPTKKIYGKYISGNYVDVPFGNPSVSSPAQTTDFTDFNNRLKRYQIATRFLFRVSDIESDIAMNTLGSFGKYYYSVDTTKEIKFFPKSMQIYGIDKSVSKYQNFSREELYSVNEGNTYASLYHSSTILSSNDNQKCNPKYIICSYPDFSRRLSMDNNLQNNKRLFEKRREYKKDDYVFQTEYQCRENFYYSVFANEAFWMVYQRDLFVNIRDLTRFKKFAKSPSNQIVQPWYWIFEKEITDESESIERHNELTFNTAAVSVSTLLNTNNFWNGTIGTGTVEEAKSIPQISVKFDAQIIVKRREKKSSLQDENDVDEDEDDSHYSLNGSTDNFNTTTPKIIVGNAKIITAIVISVTAGSSVIIGLMYYFILKRKKNGLTTQSSQVDSKEPDPLVFIELSESIRNVRSDRHSVYEYKEENIHEEKEHIEEYCDDPMTQYSEEKWIRVDLTHLRENNITVWNKFSNVAGNLWTKFVNKFQNKSVIKDNK